MLIFLFFDADSLGDFFCFIIYIEWNKQTRQKSPNNIHVSIVIIHAVNLAICINIIQRVNTNMEQMKQKWNNISRYRVKFVIIYFIVALHYGVIKKSAQRS
jgi:hypothetical protein